jgi:hypothetical protein
VLREGQSNDNAYFFSPLYIPHFCSLLNKKEVKYLYSLRGNRINCWVQAIKRVMLQVFAWFLASQGHLITVTTVAGQSFNRTHPRNLTENADGNFCLNLRTQALHMEAHKDWTDIHGPMHKNLLLWNPERKVTDLRNKEFALFLVRTAQSLIVHAALDTLEFA